MLSSHALCCHRSVLSGTGNVANLLKLAQKYTGPTAHCKLNLHYSRGYASITNAFIGPYNRNKSNALMKHENSYLLYCKRNLAQAKQKTHEIVEAPKGTSDVTVGAKVKQAGKDASYTAVVLVGIGVTGLMFYAVGRELFSGTSSTGVYTRAFKMCKNNTQVTDTLGTPLKGYGETNRRGRRRHVNHTEYELEGVKHMRMRFYVEGPNGKGTVHLEVQENARGKYEYRYLFVELDEWPHRTIVLEDNR